MEFALHCIIYIVLCTIIFFCSNAPHGKCECECHENEKMISAVTSTEISQSEQCLLKGSLPKTIQQIKN